MRRNHLMTLFALALALCFAVSSSAYDQPLTGGPTEFYFEDIMYPGDPGTTWNHAFCNEDWTGCLWTADNQDGIDCAKVTPVEGKDNCYMDYNYYQWNYTEYNPSLDGNEYKFLKVKYKFNKAASESYTQGAFWCSEDVLELSTTGDTGMHYFDMPSDADVWQEYIVNLSDMSVGATTWVDHTYRQFRIYPFGEGSHDPDAVCWVEYIAFFKTEEDAKNFVGKAVVIEEEVIEELAAAKEPAPEAEPAPAPAPAPAAAEPAAQTGDAMAIAAFITTAAAALLTALRKRK